MADPSPGVAADAPDLDDPALYTQEEIEAEVLRLRAELARVRAAVTGLADELGREWAGLHPTHRVVLRARLRETLGAP